MKKKSTIFERGQVWYWEDPLYGRRKPDTTFQIGEAAYRYSRYVIIVQTPETIDQCCCLCVPCSTGNHTPHDVPIPMEHLYHSQLTYAKCRALMPVHPKMLIRYACKVPDENMKQIDAEIIRLLCPYITDTFSSNDINEWFGIDMEAEHLTKDMIDQNHEFEDWINTFVEKELVITNDIRDRVSMKTMKTAYDVFCVNTHTIPVTADIFRFADTLVRNLSNRGVLTIGSWSELSCVISRMSEFSGVKLKDDSLRVAFTLHRPVGTPNKNDPALISGSHEETHKLPSAHMKNNWKDEAHIRCFIRDYEEIGIELCAKNFNLSQLTAKKYYSKFIAAGYTALPKEVKLPTAKDSPRSISKVSNMIVEYLKDLKVYKVAKNVQMSDKEYYARIQSACYFSLLEFLNIRVNGTKFYIPTLSAKTEHLNTWRYFDTIFHDKRVSMEKDPVQLMNLGSRYFGTEFGISRAWMPMISKRLEKMGLNVPQMTAILAPIQDLFIAKE